MRAEAARRGLSVSAKPDSYDICFVADGDTQGFLRDRLGTRPGEIVDAEGTVLGEHDGAYAYTVGQRKGLGIAAAEPLYVVAIEHRTSRVVVGPRAALMTHTVKLRDVNWLGSAMLNWEKFDWNVLLKCAECVEPSGSTSSLLTTSPFGPNRSLKTDASLGGRDWADTGA